jgi:probable ATP-dependent RNA helicase DDX4
LLPILNTILEESKVIVQPQCIIVSPTRELNMQIFNEARNFALRSYLKICIAYGGTASNHQGDNINKGCLIPVATPGRLMDFVEKTIVTFDSIRFIVLDKGQHQLII